jgi:putative heme-binding domain-containing protein
LEESEALAEMLRLIAHRQVPNSAGTLLGYLSAATPAVRVAAIESLLELQEKGLPRETLIEFKKGVVKLLDDADDSVRAVAASACGKLLVAQSVDELLAHLDDRDSRVRRNSLEALTQLRQSRAVEPALRALEHDDQELLAALKCIAQLGAPSQREAIMSAAMRSRSTEILQCAAQLLSKWDCAPQLARVQGASGTILGWKVSNPLSKDQAEKVVASAGASSESIADGWRSVCATNADSRTTFSSEKGETVRMGVTEFFAVESGRVEFRASSSGTLTIWLNGERVYQRAEPGKYATDSDTFDAQLKPGFNRLLAQVSGPGPTEVHARFRRKAALERHERLTQLALAKRGDAARGRDVFASEKAGCIKCHRLGNEGGTVGPDLTGVGRRFSKIHIVESILEPSRVVAPAFRNYAVELKDGADLTGVKVTETDTTLTLGDAQGQLHPLSKNQIKEVRPLELSIMPEGLEGGLTDAEFVDLVGFLAEQK